MRGDRPSTKPPRSRTWRFTPHARGSTLAVERQLLRGIVYPACAGIDRSLGQLPGLTHGLPRMRGDRPGWPPSWVQTMMFTPHARGSTDAFLAGIIEEKVYPACAGIDPSEADRAIGGRGLPRMRGDRPYARGDIARKYSFTPHARGSTRQQDCPQHPISVYPACAGIDPSHRYPMLRSACLPRMRGDRPPL